MPPHVKVHKDTRKLDAFMKAVRQVDGGVRVDVGVFQDKAGRLDNAGGIDNADLAAIHEFGAPEAGIPERSFLRSTLSENKAQYREVLARACAAFAKGAADGEGGREAISKPLELLGAVAVGDIQRHISEGIAPELKPATIRRKGSSTPLIDTGQLRESITYRVTVGEGASAAGEGDEG